MAKKKKIINLVELGQEEFTQFSRNLIVIEENFFKTLKIGVVQSIFHEFLVKFQIRQTVFTKKVSRILLKTSDNNFVLQNSSKFVRVSINGKFILRIDKEGNVYNPKGKKMFASFREEGNALRVMRFNDKVIAHEGDFDAISGRYFSYVNPQIDQEQYWMFVLLTCWGILLAD